MYVPNIDRIEGQAQMSVPNSDDNFSESGALLIYTSGTTGKPKGALHTHGYGIVHTQSCASNAKEAIK